MKTIAIELPVRSLERAKRFYEAVFGHAPTEIIDAGLRRITLIPGEPLVILNETAGFTPSADGSLPYFTVDDPMWAVVERASAAGGGLSGEIEARGGGEVAVFMDSEGNAITIKALVTSEWVVARRGSPRRSEPTVRRATIDSVAARVRQHERTSSHLRAAAPGTRPKRSGTRAGRMRVDQALAVRSEVPARRRAHGGPRRSATAGRRVLQRSP